MKELFKGFQNHFTHNYCKFPEPISPQISSWKMSKLTPFLLPHIMHVNQQLDDISRLVGWHLLELSQTPTQWVSKRESDYAIN
jgi:hypothetical protein